MLQSFVSRSLFQFGIYVLILIPILFFWEAKKRMGWYLAALSIIPMLAASFSVGGFSNGIAFGGFLLCFLAYRQQQLSSPMKTSTMSDLTGQGASGSLA